MSEIEILCPITTSHCDENRICRTFLFQDSNLRNVSAKTPAGAQFCPDKLLSAPSQRVESMTTIVLVGVASFLVVLAIILRARAAKAKKPEKWEKAQIVKRLLALSENEDIVNGTSRQQPVSQSPTPYRRAAAASTSPSRSVRPA
jgi:hypothetical protein